MAGKAKKVLEQLHGLGVLKPPSLEEPQAEPVVEEGPEVDRGAVLVEAVDATIGRLDTIAGELAELRAGLVALRQDLGTGGLPAPRQARPGLQKAVRPKGRPVLERSAYPMRDPQAQEVLPATVGRFADPTPRSQAEATVLQELMSPGEAPAAARPPQSQQQGFGDYLGMGALREGAEVRHVREEG